MNTYHTRLRNCRHCNLIFIDARTSYIISKQRLLVLWSPLLAASVWDKTLQYRQLVLFLLFPYQPDTLLPRPRKIIFSDRRLLLRVQPPRAFPNSERERIIGICFHIHTTSWTWTRKIFSLYSGLVRRKYRLSGLVYDQLDLLKRMLHTDVEVSVWYMDKYGQGQQRSLTFRINDGEFHSCT